MAQQLLQRDDGHPAAQAGDGVGVAQAMAAETALQTGAGPGPVQRGIE
jgi:hypothetical protein